MSALFMQAAASYFGMGETRARRSELFTDGGDLVAVFEVVLGPDDMAGVLERMKVLQAAQSAPGEANGGELVRGVTREDWNALTAAERSRFGSFGRYQALNGLTSDAADFGGLPG